MPNIQNKILKIILLLILLIAAIHITAYYFHLYLELPWIDMVVHFLGGAWVAAFSIWLVFFSGLFSFGIKNTLLNFFVAAFVIVFIVGIAWEIFEFKTGLSFFLPLALSAKGYWLDTISDLIFDLAGSAMISLYFYSLYRRNILPT